MVLIRVVVFYNMSFLCHPLAQPIYCFLLQSNKKSINDSCAICLCNLDDEVFTLPCNHSFHFDCYCKIENDKCPLCRKVTRF